MRLAPTLLAPIALLLVGCPPDQSISQIVDPPDEPDTDTETWHDSEADTDPVPDDVLTGGIMGRICAPNGWRYINDAKVSIEHPWGVAVTYTDEEGFFILDGIPAGEHVVIVQKGSFMTQFSVLISPNEVLELASEECLRDDLNIAVVTGEYDHIQSIIDELGVTYTVIDGMFNGPTAPHRQFLLDPAAMEEFDVIFFNCGLNYEALQTDFAFIGNNLREFVENGGSVYTSDWAYFLSERAFPDMVEFRGNDDTLLASATGAAGAVTATVFDAAMQGSLGSDQAQITFDLDVWITAEGAGPGTSTMVYSKYQYWNDTYTKLNDGEGPLAVKLETAGGRVIFTSFHNEQQVTLDMVTLMEEIIFAL